jgi:6-phosphogluconolactonase
MSIERFNFADAQQLDVALVAGVVALLQADIEQHGRAILVVSGGRTPTGFLQLLSRQTLDWRRVTVTLADERWVDAEHADSNEKLIRQNLLLNNADAATFIGLKNSAATATLGQAMASQTLARLGRFTVVILGMGEDGHTASLFPGSADLPSGLNMESGLACIAITPEHAAYQRISLTLPRLLNSRRIILHFSGASKLKVLASALAGDDVLAMPVRAILKQQQTPLAIYASPTLK